MTDSVSLTRPNGCNKDSDGSFLRARASRGTKCVKRSRPPPKTACSPGKKRTVKKTPKRRLSKSPKGRRVGSCKSKAPKRRNSRSISTKSKAPKRRRSNATKSKAPKRKRSSSTKSKAPKRRRSRSSSKKCKGTKRGRSPSGSKKSTTPKRRRFKSTKSKSPKRKRSRGRRSRSASNRSDRIIGSPSGCRSPSKPVSTPACPPAGTSFKKPVGGENRKLPPGVFISYYLDLLKKAQKEAGRNGNRPQIAVMAKKAAVCWKTLDDATKERYRKKYCAELKRIKRRQAGGGRSC